MNEFDWKYVGKIASSVALSALIAFFWISNHKKNPEITQPKGEFRIGQNLVSHFANKKALVVFWATWCESCKKDLTGLKNLQTEEPQLANKFSFIAINTDSSENLQKAKDLWAELDLKNIKFLYDQDKKHQEDLSVDLLPTYFVFEENGKARLRLEGIVNWKDSKILSLLTSDEN